MMNEWINNEHFTSRAFEMSFSFGNGELFCLHWNYPICRAERFDNSPSNRVYCRINYNQLTFQVNVRERERERENSALADISRNVNGSSYPSNSNGFRDKLLDSVFIVIWFDSVQFHFHFRSIWFCQRDWNIRQIVFLGDRHRRVCMNGKYEWTGCGVEIDWILKRKLGFWHFCVFMIGKMDKEDEMKAKNEK